MRAARLQLVGAPILVPLTEGSRTITLTVGCVYELRVAPVVVVDEDGTALYEVPVYAVQGDAAGSPLQPYGHPVVPSAPLRFVADVETITLLQAPYAAPPAWASSSVFASISQVE